VRVPGCSLFDTAPPRPDHEPQRQLPPRALREHRSTLLPRRVASIHHPAASSWCCSSVLPQLLRLQAWPRACVARRCTRPHLSPTPLPPPPAPSSRGSAAGCAFPRCTTTDIRSRSHRTLRTYGCAPLRDGVFWWPVICWIRVVCRIPGDVSYRLHRPVA